MVQCDVRGEVALRGGAVSQGEKNKDKWTYSVRDALRE
jgi:hypothetical protein